MGNIGYIHSYESLAAVDGAGLRYAVFLSGCPLRCVFCHNPDTWDMTAGTPTDAPSLVKKLTRYKPYFKTTGGVTFSGGEPLLQAAFLREMAQRLAEVGIRYVIDTSGEVALTEDVTEVLAHAQGVLLDIKFPDDAMYRRYTGHGIERPLCMLEHLSAIGCDTSVRTVIVPGINDSEAHLDRYLALLRGFRIRRFELLPFHTMGYHKYTSLGIQNPLAEAEALPSEVHRRLQAYADERMSQPTR